MRLLLAAAMLFPAISLAQSVPCSSRMTPLWSLESKSLAGERTIAEGLLRAGATRLWGGTNLSVHRDEGGVDAFAVRYPMGSINPSHPTAPVGGVGFLLSDGAERAHACLSYEVRFPEGFQFAKGGKLPGMYGGRAPSGGDAVAEGDGFSARFMWRREGAGEVYLYQPGHAARYGDSIGRGAWAFHPGKWQRLDQEIVTNSIGQRDGVIRAWLDGRQVLEQGAFELRERSYQGVAGIMFSTFFGGHDASWASPFDQTVEFRHITFLGE
jgi:hypothetical protein